MLRYVTLSLTSLEHMKIRKSDWQTPLPFYQGASFNCVDENDELMRISGPYPHPGSLYLRPESDKGNVKSTNSSQFMMVPILCFLFEIVEFS